MYSVFGMELPSPLDKAEEERLLQDFHENRQIFLERNLRLVLHIAKKYDVNQSDLKELFSVGEMGLIKAENDKIKVTKKGKIKTTKIGYFFDCKK